MQIHTRDLEVHSLSYFADLVFFSFQIHFWTTSPPEQAMSPSLTPYSFFPQVGDLGGCPYKKLSAQFSSYDW